MYICAVISPLYSTHSHSLLTTEAAGSLSHAPPATLLPRHCAAHPLPLPLHTFDGGVGEGEGDILYQWRMRRRLEQAHRHTAGLAARLDGGGPLFKSQPLRAGYHPGRRVRVPADTEQPPPITGAVISAVYGHFNHSYHTITYPHTTLLMCAHTYDYLHVPYMYMPCIYM